MIYRLLALLILPISYSIGSQLVEEITDAAYSDRHNRCSLTLDLNQIERLCRAYSSLKNSLRVRGIKDLSAPFYYVTADYRETDISELEVVISGIEHGIECNRQSSHKLLATYISAQRLRQAHTFLKPTPPIQKVTKSSSSTSTSQNRRRPVTRSQSSHTAPTKK